MYTLIDTAKQVVFTSSGVLEMPASHFAPMRFALKAPETMPAEMGVTASGSNCAACGINSASKRCSRCKSVRYCSSNCQRTHWKIAHKQQCSAPTKEGAGMHRRKKRMKKHIQRLDVVHFPTHYVARLPNWSVPLPLCVFFSSTLYEAKSFCALNSFM
jgi:hypothetical protein